MHCNEHNYLNNIEEKSLSTEKRVLELERQLEKMRKLLNDDSEKNLAAYNNNNFVDPMNNNNNQPNHLVLDDMNAHYNKKSKQINESDTTLRDIDIDQEFSNQESEENFNNMVYDHNEHMQQQQQQQLHHQLYQHTHSKPAKKRSKNRKSSSKRHNRPSGSQSTLPMSVPAQVNENYFLKNFNKTRSRSAEDNLLQRSNSRSQCHYRLKLGDIPFVVGKVRRFF